MTEEEIDNYWSKILSAIPSSIHPNFIIQNWMDGVLISVSDTQGNVIKTVGAETLSKAISKL